MLVLTRRAGESIVIGDDVRVVVLDVRGDTVRLGIEAPRSVQVHRAEVYAEVQAANAAAAHAGTDLGSVADRLQRIARPRPQRGARPSPAHLPAHPPGEGAKAPDDAAAPGAAAPGVAAPGAGPVGSGPARPGAARPGALPPGGVTPGDVTPGDVTSSTAAQLPAVPKPTPPPPKR